MGGVKTGGVDVVVGEMVVGEVLDGWLVESPLSVIANMEGVMGIFSAVGRSNVALLKGYMDAEKGIRLARVVYMRWSP